MRVPTDNEKYGSSPAASSTRLKNWVAYVVKYIGTTVCVNCISVKLYSSENLNGTVVSEIRGNISFYVQFVPGESILSQKYAFI